MVSTLTHRCTANVLLFSAAALLFSGCSLKPAKVELSGKRFADSGTIILSQVAPAKNAPSTAGSGATNFAPLIGYFPPASAYLPADNETWLEINRSTKKVSVYRGGTTIKEIQAEGAIPVEPGDYYLDYKQKDPRWYAPDEYFLKRKLTVPPTDSPLRYRRGALGKYALFPKADFPIHCAPVWTDDVGGLRVSVADLSSIYYLLPYKAAVVIK